MVYIKTYKELIVWQNAIELVQLIYFISNRFPKEEIYTLTSQMRRATISIPSNIAEGYGRKSKKEYIQFLRIAYGFCLELETQLIISNKLMFLNSRQLRECTDRLIEVMKMLNSMISKLSK